MKKILIIDDDAIIRQVIRAGLEEEGYEVYELESGKKACNIIEEHGIDLITLDLFMDDREGLETLQEIRRQFKGQPIVIISSSDDFFDLVLDMGATKTLHKPFDLDQLLSIVNSLLA